MCAAELTVCSVGRDTGGASVVMPVMAVMIMPLRAAISAARRLRCNGASLRAARRRAGRVISAPGPLPPALPVRVVLI